MAEFVSFDPNVEVRGQSMLSVVAGMNESMRGLIQLYGLDKLQPDTWYPLQPILDFYREVSRARNGALNLVSTGIKVPEKAVFPPEIDSIEKAMLVLDDAYHMNHRGGDIGHYHAHIVGARHVDIVAETPFPCDLDYGIILGLARRFKPDRASLTVFHDARCECRKRGGRTCTYHVRW